MGQATVCAGGDIQEMEAALQQEGVEGFGVAAAGLGRQGIVVEEGEAGLLVGLKDAPGKEGAHVQLRGPGGLEDRLGQLMAQLSEGQALGLLNKIVLVLKGREALQDRHDPVKGAKGLLLVGP